jgi:hypothetical protein
VAGKPSDNGYLFGTRPEYTFDSGESFTVETEAFEDAMHKPHCS